eukprot:Sdes_comp9628_c0_seq1m1110
MTGTCLKNHPRDKSNSPKDSTRLPAYNITGSDNSSNLESDDEEDDMPARIFREKAAAIREDISSHFEERIRELLNETERIMKIQRQGNFKAASKKKKLSPLKNSASTLELKEKIFVARESFLTEMLTVNHFQTLYNIFIAVLIVFGLQSMAQSYFEKGRIIDFSLFAWNFEFIDVALSIVFGMHVHAFLVRSFLKIWALDSVFPNQLWLLAYIFYAFSLWIWPALNFYQYKFPPASSLVILCEQARLFMKMHSFVRENVSRILAAKSNPNWSPQQLDAIFPSPQKLLYFLFSPTLIYRDQYPRTSSIRWNYVFINFGQCVAILFYVNFIFERFCLPLTRNLGLEPTNLKFVVLSVFQAMLPG